METQESVISEIDEPLMDFSQHLFLLKELEAKQILF